MDAARDCAGRRVVHIYNEYLIFAHRADGAVPLPESVGVSDGSTFMGEQLLGGDVVGHEHNPDKSKENKKRKLAAWVTSLGFISDAQEHTYILRRWSCGATFKGALQVC